MNKEQTKNNLKTNNQTEKNLNNESNTQNKKKKGQSKLHLLKVNYSKACFILNKIKRNKLNGTPHVNDEKDRKKYLAVVHEYEEYKKRQTNSEKKAGQNQELLIPKAEKQLEVSKTDKAGQGLKTVNKTNQNVEDTLLKSNQTNATRRSLEIFCDELCLVVVNEIEGYFKPVNQTEWSMINNKLNELIMNYLLHSDSGIPRYSTGEMYRDYILIQCNDMFSKEFICNCVAKLRYAFDGMSLTVIPAAQIPDALKERLNFEMKEEPLPPAAWRNDSEDSKNSDFVQDQGFQLSVNYFESDIEDSMKSSRCREQMPNTAADISSKADCKNSLKSLDSNQQMPWEASINYSDSSCEESVKSFNSKNPNFDKNQGFQLSVNYFESGIEDSIERDQMPDPLASVNPFITDFKGSLKSPDSNEQALLDKKRENYYKGYKRKLNQLAELEELTSKQRKLKRKSENFIRKYEMCQGLEKTKLQLELKQNSKDVMVEQQQNSIPTGLARNITENQTNFSPSLNASSFHAFDREKSTEFSQFSMANKRSNILWNYEDSSSERFNAIKDNPSWNTEGSEFSSSNRSLFEPKKEEINEFRPYQQYNEMPNNQLKYDNPYTETRGNSVFWAEHSNNNNIPQSFSELNNTNVKSFNKTGEPLPFGAESSRSYSETRGVPRLDTSEVSLISRNLLNQELPSFSKQLPEINQTLTNAINFADNRNSFNNAQCLKDSTRSILEKRIYEYRNALGGISADITTKERGTDSDKAKDLIVQGKPSDTYPPISHLKRKLNSLGKRISNLPVVEVISLTDDSDNSDVEEVKSNSKKMAEEECIKALEYLKNMQHREPNSLSQRERLQIGICRHKVNKYKQMLGLKDEEADIKTVKNNSLQNTRMEVTNCGSREKKRRIASENTSPNSSFKGKPGFWVTGNSNSKQTSETTAQLSEQSCATTTHQESSFDASGSYESLLPVSKSNPNLEFAIIDRNQEDFKIRTEAWHKIEQNLLETLAREMEQTKNPNIGLFHGTYWRYGIKIIHCENMESLYFIKRFIHNQHIFWPNTQFDVIPVSELPRRAIVKIWIPPPLIEDMAVLRILKAQNTQFYSLDWTLINAHERNNKNGKDFYISISATSLERLRTTNGQIRFGTNRLKMILPEEDPKGS